MKVEDKEHITAMAFSKDDQWVATGALSGIIRLANLTQPTNTRSFRAHIGGGVSYLSFSPDNLTLASIGIRKVKLWNVHTAQHLFDLIEPGPRSSGAFVEFAPDGESLAYGVYQNEFGIVHAPKVDVDERPQCFAEKEKETVLPLGIARYDCAVVKQARPSKDCRI